MAWIFGIIVVIGFGYLMFINETFRRFGFGVIGLIGAGVGVLWLLTENSNRKYEAERERERTAIPISQLTISDLQLLQDRYGSWRVTGTVLNRSPHHLRMLSLRVYLRDCPTSTSDQGCITTGQDDARFTVAVPSGQARRLDTTVYFDHAAVGQNWRWAYGVTEIEAEID